AASPGCTAAPSPAGDTASRPLSSPRPAPATYLPGKSAGPGLPTLLAPPQHTPPPLPPTSTRPRRLRGGPATTAPTQKVGRNSNQSAHAVSADAAALLDFPPSTTGNGRPTARRSAPPTAPAPAPPPTRSPAESHPDDDTPAPEQA